LLRFLPSNKKNVDPLTMTDKLNKLEKRAIIAEALNMIYDYCFQLIKIKDHLFSAIHKATN